jgi:hypothetical protein
MKKKKRLQRQGDAQEEANSHQPVTAHQPSGRSRRDQQKANENHRRRGFLQLKKTNINSCITPKVGQGQVHNREPLCVIYSQQQKQMSASNRINGVQPRQPLTVT